MKIKSKTPCVLFDCHHPKHFLVLRQLGRKCEEQGINVIWTVRNKDVLVDLVLSTGNNPYVLTHSKNGLVGLLGELFAYDLKLMQVAKRYRPIALMGNSISITHAGKILNIPSLLINDDDAAANPQYPYLGYPFATRIITPECIKETYGRRHRKYSGIHELAYLHPNIYKPDPLIWDELNAGHGDRIFLIRTVALKASHDFGAKGLPVDLIRKLIQKLKCKGKVYISSETTLADEFKPYKLPTPPSRMHDVLAACDLLIGDSQTMAAEAAVLGTPSVRMNSFVNRISYLNELEFRYGLTYGFKPEQIQPILSKIKELLETENLSDIWQQKRATMLQDWIDPTEVFWDELKCFMER